MNASHPTRRQFYRLAQVRSLGDLMAWARTLKSLFSRPPCQELGDGGSCACKRQDPRYWAGKSYPKVVRGKSLARDLLLSKLWTPRSCTGLSLIMAHVRARRGDWRQRSVTGRFRSF